MASIVKNLKGNKLEFLVRSKDNRTLFRGTEPECKKYLKPKTNRKKTVKKNKWL